MTIWKINPKAAETAPAVDADLASMMAALDALPTEKRSAPQRKAAPQPTLAAPPVFIQQWFPRAIICHGVHQDCRCGQTWESINGLYLEDQHRNGALRQLRTEANVVPPEYFGLPTRQEWAMETVAFCAICFQTEFRLLEPDLPQDLVRALSPEDLNSLKEGTA